MANKGTKRSLSIGFVVDISPIMKDQMASKLFMATHWVEDPQNTQLIIGYFVPDFVIGHTK